MLQNHILPTLMRYSYQSISFCLFALYVLTSGNVFAQGEANVWIGPTRVGLDFNSGSPTTFLTGAARGSIDATNREGEGCSTVSDSLGGLLFYTEGVNVYDRTHAVMSNGTGLLGNLSSTQSAVIVPCPRAPRRFYYIFCAPPEEASASPGGSSTSSDGITYSIVDMTLNGGLGAVTTKNVRVTPAGENATEGLTVVPNFAGNGFWVIAHQAGTKTSAIPAVNKFYIYGVTTAGITAATGVITAWNNQSANAGTAIAGVPASNSGNGQVIIKSDNCFKKLAMTFFAKNSLVELYNFDNSTGAISLANSITNVINNQVYGVEFSPNGRYLYVTILETSHRVYQFDISSGVDATINAAAARTTWTPTGTTSLRWGQLQLGPDGKIYMSHHVDYNAIGTGSPHASIGVFNTPDVVGIGAGFVEQKITSTTLTGTGTKHGLPQIYKGFIAGVASVKPGVGLAGLDQVCVGEPADFDANYTQSGINWRWNIDANVGPNTTNEYFTQNITHTYSGPGTFDVILALEDAVCLYTVTEKTQIIVNPVINTTASSSCSPLRGNVTAPDGTKTYVWYTDAAMTKPFATGTTNVSLPLESTGTVYVKAQNTVIPTTTTNNLQTSIGHASNDPGLITQFTVSNTIRLNSFQWYYGNTFVTSINNITIAIENNAGTTVYWTNTRNGIDAADNVTELFTETVNTLLGPGNYRIRWSGGPTNTVRFWTSPTTNITDANASITSGDRKIGNFNYSITTYALSNPVLACSKAATVTFNCPLPVTWLSFNGKRSGDVVDLDWSTASEQNSKAFHVQRSIDGINFETIAKVDAAGNSNSVKSYTYTDLNAPLVSAYYRLLQEDIDGTSIFSKIVYVNGVGSFSLSLVPNPGNGSFALVGLSGDVKLNVVVYNITGQSVYNKIAYPGEVIDLEGVAKGFYIVKVVSGTTEQSIRYINQ